MRIEVNITKTKFFVILGAVLILAGVIAGYAYTSTFDRTADQAQTWGHSADEVVVKMADGSTKTVEELLKSGSAGGAGGSPEVFFSRFTYTAEDRFIDCYPFDGNPCSYNDGFGRYNGHTINVALTGNDVCQVQGGVCLGAGYETSSYAFCGVDLYDLMRSKYLDVNDRWKAWSGLGVYCLKGGAGGVSKINAGSGVTISPPTGIGEVTISSTGGGSGVSSIVAGTGISVSASTGAVTVSNTVKSVPWQVVNQQIGSPSPVDGNINGQTYTLSGGCTGAKFVVLRYWSCESRAFSISTAATSVYLGQSGGCWSDVYSSPIPVGSNGLITVTETNSGGHGQVFVYSCGG